MTWHDVLFFELESHTQNNHLLEDIDITFVDYFP